MFELIAPSLCGGRRHEENPGDIVESRPLLVVVAVQVNLGGDPGIGVAQQLLDRFRSSPWSFRIVPTEWRKVCQTMSFVIPAATAAGRMWSTRAESGQ